MKKIFYLLSLSLVIFATSCKKEEAPEEGSFNTLTTYLKSKNLDMTDVIKDWIVPAPTKLEEVDAFIAKYDILDIRSADAFAEGHIEGATNTALKNILTAAEKTNKPILVVCYSGQTAAHAVVGLKLSGYADAKTLKYGMCGWNSEYTSWSSNTKDIESDNWIKPSNITATGSFTYPTFTTTATDGVSILEERVTKMLDGGLSSIKGQEVLDNPTNYFINNYWAQADVDKYGHIKGAYRINPLSIDLLKGLDGKKTVVTYCWTGQTSSMVTAYLTVLGYDAKSLSFGANGMIYSALDADGKGYKSPPVDLPVVK